MSETYNVPSHLETLAREVAPIITLLQNALTGLPVQAFGAVIDDAPDTLCTILDGVSESVQKIAATLNELGEQAANQSPTDSAICAAASRLLSECHTFVQTYRKLQQTAFSEDTEMGKQLVSAIFERLLRTVLDALVRVRVVVENPAAAVAQYGTHIITLTAVFNIDREIALFQQWLNDQQPICCKTPVFNKKTSIIKLILLGLGIGWLWGRNDG